MTAERTPDARVEAAVERMSRVMGWQHLTRYAGMSPEWMGDVLGALATAALAAADAVQRKAPQVAAQVRYADGEWSREYAEDDATPQDDGPDPAPRLAEAARAARAWRQRQTSRAPAVTLAQAWEQGWDASVDAAERCDVAGGDFACGECAACRTPNPYAEHHGARP